MVRPVHVCCGVVFRQPQSTVLMAYQPGASGVPAFSPTVSPGCVTEPARAGAAVQSDRTPAAANFVNLLFICISPIAPRRRSVADRSAEPHLVYGPRCFCPMVTRSRQIAPRTFHRWTFLGTVKLSKTSYRVPRWFCQFLLEHQGAVAAGTHVKPRGRQPGHGRQSVSRPSSFTVGTTRRNGTRRLICDPPSEDVNMSIRGKTVLITLAITLIGTAPAWSQSLVKTV